MTELHLMIACGFLFFMSVRTRKARYLRSPERDQVYHGRTPRRPFMAGMPRRINERLDEMRVVRERGTTTTMQSDGRALVLQTKREIVTDKFASIRGSAACALARHAGRASATTKAP
jgi:hypothetical protein